MGSKFVQAYLSSGERVEVPLALRDRVAGREGQTLVFVERRRQLFSFVQWVGTPVEALRAIRRGELGVDDVPAEIRAIGASELWSELSLRPRSTCDLFISQLSRLSAREWMSLVLNPKIAVYEAHCEPVHRRLRDIAGGDPGIARALDDLDGRVARAVLGTLPTLPGLRDDMRPYAVPGSTDLSPESYQTFRAEAVRRTTHATIGLLLSARLTPTEAFALYAPFERFIPLTDLVG